VSSLETVDLGMVLFIIAACFACFHAARHCSNAMMFWLVWGSMLLVYALLC
jgi:hypothetical protein